MEKHDLICSLKQLADELGRQPIQKEFNQKVRNGEKRIKAAFGCYADFLRAAGFEPKWESRKKIDNSIFEVDIAKHLIDYSPKEIFEMIPWTTWASISDTHAPFVNHVVVEKFEDYCEENQPEFIFLNGDAWDMYSHTKFPRSHNVFTPREEQAQARKWNEEFWKRLRKKCPKSKFVQSLGNHDCRPLKRVLEEYPEAEDWIVEKIKSLFTFEGVETIFDPRQEFILPDGTLVFHGYRGKLGEHRDFTQHSTINGHTHLGGTVFRRFKGRTLYECNSGFAGDPNAKGLTYTPQRIANSTPGFAAGDKYGPRFIPVG